MGAQAITTPTSETTYYSERSLKKTLRHTFNARTEFLFWANVGVLNQSTGIYIGNGFVLTAAHVGPGQFHLSDGSSYLPEPGTLQGFRNANGSLVDLCVFRLQSKEGDSIRKLTPIPFGPVRPPSGSHVLLIGAGGGNALSPLASSRRTVLNWNHDFRVKWGLNRVEYEFRNPIETYSFRTPGFSTEYTDDHKHEGQATPGDSGGAAFVYNRQTQRWELGGLILAVDTQEGKVAFGDQTYIADLTILPKNAFSRNGFFTLRNKPNTNLRDTLVANNLLRRNP